MPTVLLGAALAETADPAFPSTRPKPPPWTSPQGVKGNDVLPPPERAEAFSTVKDALWWGGPATSLPPQEPPGTRHSGFWVLDSGGGRRGVSGWWWRSENTEVH